MESIKKLQNLPESFIIRQMQPEKRQQLISEYLQSAEFASLDEIAEHVKASVSTVRRDLLVLEVTGGVRRTHGGARVLTPKSDEFTFSTRETHQLAEKELIGRACADLIAPNQTVILDAGTTIYQVARYLEAKAPQIITNSLPIANLYASANKVEVLVSGGTIYPRLGVLVGPLAVESFSRLHGDVAVMSAGGLSLDGITNSHGLLIDIQKAMIKGAQRVIFCLDHTKLGRKSILPLCGLDAVDVVVTDEGAPAELISSLRERSIEVVIASAVPAVNSDAE